MTKIKFFTIALAVLFISCIASGVFAKDKKTQPIQPEIISVEAGRNEAKVIIKGAASADGWTLLIGNTPIEFMGDPSLKGDTLTITIPPCALSCETKIEAKHKDDPLLTKKLEIKSSLSAAGEQPDIIGIQPRGGREGSEMTITGMNLGKDLKDVLVCLRKEIKNGENITLGEAVSGEYLSLTKPKADKKEPQQLKFTIPGGQKLSEWQLWPNTVRVAVFVKGHPIKPWKIKVVGNNFYDWLILPAVLLIIFLIAIVCLIVRCWNIKTLFMDIKTNTYSLSKCQAIAWTTVLIGSYFYLAIGRSIIIEKGVIPDFNASLLPLMGVSYGGMLIAQYIGVFISKKDIERTPPALKDLISEGGEMSISRLQLVCFNITAIAVYLYNLSGPALLVNGLPDMPNTLLGLVGVSQGGYLFGKVTGGKTSVNYVVPRHVKPNIAGMKLTLIGTSFLTNTKVLIQDVPELKDTNLLNGSTLTLDLPTLTREGPKQLILIPPNGSSIVIDNAFEVVDVQIEKIKRDTENPKSAKITLKGFDMQIIPDITITGSPATVTEIDRTTKTLTVIAITDIAADAAIKVTSVDGELSVEGKITAS